MLIERLSNLFFGCSAPPHKRLKLEENQLVPGDRRAGNQNNECNVLRLCRGHGGNDPSFAVSAQTDLPRIDVGTSLEEFHGREHDYSVISSC